MSRSGTKPRVLDLLRSTRPGQWIKNALVVTVPVAAGSPEVLSPEVLSVVAAFVLVSGGMYTFNDILDKEIDQSNPHKKDRPVASGRISAKTAATLASVCLLSGFVLALVAGTSVFAVLLTYALLVAAYSIELKKLPWLEVAIIAAGFVLRVLAGGIVADAPVTPGFLATITAGAVLVVLGKRYSELVNSSGHQTTTRASLKRYSTRSLRLGMSASLLATIIAYGYTAVTRYDPERIWSLLYLFSCVPVLPAGAIFVKQAIDGKAESPEKLLISNRPLALLAALWTGLFAFASYKVLA